MNVIDFKAAFESTPGCCVLLDIDAPNYTILAATADYIQISEKNKTELIGRALFETFPESPIDPDFNGHKNLSESFQKVISQKKKCDLPVQRYDTANADGEFSEHYWRVTNIPVFDDNNNVIYIIHSPENITHEIKSEKQAEKLKAFKQAHHLFKHAPECMYILKGSDYTIDLANETVLELWKKTSEEVLYKPYFEIFPEIRQQGYKELLDDVRLTGKIFKHYETPILFNQNGTEQLFFFDFVYQPYYENNDDKPSGVIIFAIDVTDKIQSAKKIEESENLNRILVEEASVAVALYRGKDHAIQYANDIMLGKWGRDKSIIGLPLAKAIPELEGQPFLGYFDEVFRTGVPHVGLEDKAELFVDGKLQASYYNYTYKAIRNHNGEISGIHHMAVEVTELVLAKQALQENEQRLEKMVSERTKDLTDAKMTLEEKNQALEAMNKELESFAYISSHDLQEPLRKIQTFASRVIDNEYEKLSENSKVYFEKMQNAALRMQTLIDDLLTYSRTNSEERVFELVELTTLIDDIKEEIAEDIEVYHATVEVVSSCEARIIPFQFRQLLHNLMGNALKFSRPERLPHITITCHCGKSTDFALSMLLPEKDYCHIQVKDNGIGFDPEYGDKIFKVFQRLHSRDKYNGTGIGLAIVKKIIENHEGFITATGKQNEGATFDIYLPY